MIYSRRRILFICCIISASIFVIGVWFMQFKNTIKLLKTPVEAETLEKLGKELKSLKEDYTKSKERFEQQKKFLQQNTEFLKNEKNSTTTPTISKEVLLKMTEKLNNENTD